MGKLQFECSFKFRVGMDYDCDRVKETGFSEVARALAHLSLLLRQNSQQKQPRKQGFPLAASLLMA